MSGLFQIKLHKAVQLWSFVVLILILGADSISAVKYSKIFWKETDEWSHCSTSCGSGVQLKKLACVGQDIYKSIRPVNQSKCADVDRPISVTSRSCNLGECQYRYIWRVEREGACSQTCGQNGYRVRDIGCYYIVRGNTTISTDRDNCPIQGRPMERTRCNHFDCPAEFSSTKWAKCPKHRSDPCLPGIQRRRPMCTKTLRSGETKILPIRVCYTEVGRVKKVSFWRYCYEYVNTKECLSHNKKIAEITKSDITVIQMRKAKRMKLQIGQTAYVIPWTRLIIKCPVNHYVSRNIQWQKGSDPPIEYRGRAKEGRIRVDSKGRLKIRRFLVADQGEWYCMAGDVKARIIIKIRSPSAGFHDWAHRNTLWNEEMLNEDPKTNLIKREVVQWVSSHWTKCSISCGAKGYQTRSVHCEKIDTRFYHVLEDKVCTSKSLPKPDTKRSCNDGSECPVWKMSNVDKSVCTNNCLGINKGSIQGELTCVQQGLNLQFDKCNSIKMPQRECNNPMCQVKWNISKWSACSQSCGPKGVSARHLTCVWVVSGKPAGALCYENELPIPEVIRTCTPSPCKLRCLDLSPHCDKKTEFCRFTIYRFQCCKSCSKKT